MGENPSGRRAGDGGVQDLRPAIGERLDEMAVELRRILVEQGFDIGARRRRGAFAGQEGDAQAGARGIGGVERQGLAKRGDRFVAALSASSASPRPNQPGAQAGASSSALREKIARGLEIARVQARRRPIDSGGRRRDRRKSQSQ